MIITCVILFKIAYVESVLSFFKKHVLREVKYNKNSMCQIQQFYNYVLRKNSVWCLKWNFSKIWSVGIFKPLSQFSYLDLTFLNISSIYLSGVSHL